MIIPISAASMLLLVAPADSIDLPAMALAVSSTPVPDPQEPKEATAPPLTLSTPDGAAPSTPADPQAPPAAPEPRGQAPASESTNTIVVTGRARSSPGDPFETANAKSFAVTQKVDEAIVGPVAIAYQRGVPEPVRRSLRNFHYNLHEPVVFINYLLQLHPGKAAETFGRFAVNSTIGVVGLFDVAKKQPFNLPRRPNGFADTLGYYGVKPGPFFYVPLMGPTTLRDLIGGAIDRLVLPLGVGKPFNKTAYTLPNALLSTLDRRAEFDEQLLELRQAADPYTARRDFYLRKRQEEIDSLRHRHRATPALSRDLTNLGLKATTPPIIEVAPANVRLPHVSTVPAPTVGQPADFGSLEVPAQVSPSGAEVAQRATVTPAAEAGRLAMDAGRPTMQAVAAG